MVEDCTEPEAKPSIILERICNEFSEHTGDFKNNVSTERGGDAIFEGAAKLNMRTERTPVRVSFQISFWSLWYQNNSSERFGKTGTRKWK